VYHPKLWRIWGRSVVRVYVIYILYVYYMYTICILYEYYMYLKCIHLIKKSSVLYVSSKKSANLIWRIWGRWVVCVYVINICILYVFEMRTCDREIIRVICIIRKKSQSSLKDLGQVSGSWLWDINVYTMGWLRCVGSLKLQFSFAKEPYKRDDILQKRLTILRSLLMCIPWGGYD